MADLDYSQFMPKEKSKGERVTQNIILPILSALEQISTSRKTRGQFVGNSVAQQMKGYADADESRERARNEALDRALRLRQITGQEEEEAGKARKESERAARFAEFGSAMGGIPDLPETERANAAQRALAKYDPEEYAKSAAFPKPSMESEIAKAVAMLKATEPIRQKSAMEADRIRREREAKELAEKPLSGDAAKLGAAMQSVAKDVPRLRALIQQNGARWVATQYKIGDPTVNTLIDNLADAKGRIRSGGAVNDQEAARFIKPFASVSQVLRGDTGAMEMALNSLENEASEAAKGIGRPTTPGGGSPYEPPGFQMTKKLVWLRGDDGKEYEFDEITKQPTGKVR